MLPLVANSDVARPKSHEAEAKAAATPTPQAGRPGGQSSGIVTISSTVMPIVCR